jgi:succinate dehydrogenase / fumarate reductase, cytochrome b subunit
MAADAMDARPTTSAPPLGAKVLAFAQSSIGAKVVMAVSGLLMFGFAIAHLAGNLLIYAGREAFNQYAAALHAVPELLWVARLGLIAATVAHIVSAIRCNSLNAQARPVPYAFGPKTPVKRSATAMIYSGGFVLAYLGFHLAHLTFRATHPEHVQLLPDGHNTDVYLMAVKGFSIWWISGFYVVAMLLLASHLSHGIYSMVQHLGLYGRSWTPFVKISANVIGWGLCLAFASIPISVLLGLVK